MLTDPLTLFDQTIDNLETLAAVLADEIDDRMYASGAERSAPVYRAAHGKIGALLPLLRAARATQEAARRTGQRSFCLNCD